MTPLLPDRIVSRRGDVLPTRSLLDAGLSRERIRKAVQRGELARIRPGWFWVKPAEAHPTQWYRAQSVAAVNDARTYRRDLALAGPAAALHWGLPLVGTMPPQVTVAGGHRSGPGASNLIRAIGDVPQTQLMTHNGVAVTTPARAALDTARICGTRAGLVACDAALARGLASPADLRETLETLATLRGVRHARWCTEHADGLAESPGESISRHAMIEAGIARPVLQFTLELRPGWTIRVDFYWPELQVVGEFDGLIKYRPSPATGGRPEEAVIAEKRREDAMRARGLQVIRWTWTEAWAVNPLVSLLLATVGPSQSSERARITRTRVNSGAFS